jgi:hypothetical protein
MHLTVREQETIIPHNNDSCMLLSGKMHPSEHLKRHIVIKHSPFLENPTKWQKPSQVEFWRRTLTNSDY